LQQKKDLADISDGAPLAVNPSRRTAQVPQKQFEGIGSYKDGGNNLFPIVDRLFNKLSQEPHFANMKKQWLSMNNFPGLSSIRHPLLHSGNKTVNQRSESNKIIARTMFEDLEKEFNIKVVGTSAYGIRQLTSNKPVRTPSDLNGFKLRVPEQNICVEYGKAMGAEPTPIAYAEAYMALQQGVVDGLENILVPVFIPLMQELGIDPVHFGVMMILNLMIGILSPPFGTVLFVLSSVAKVPVERVAKDTSIFLLPLMIVLVMIVLFPQLTLFLPDLIFGR
jgi:hypothetical protein